MPTDPDDGCTCGEPKGAHYPGCAVLAARAEQRAAELADPELARLWLSELWQPVREYHGEPFRRRPHPNNDAPVGAPHPTRGKRRA